MQDEKRKNFRVRQEKEGDAANMRTPTKIELPHFPVGTAYGGSQDWCESRWMKIGGCAAITACDSAIYFTLYKGRQGPYPYGVETISR